jgi:hypothetical protein
MERLVPMVLLSFVLEAGETKEYEMVWEQLDNDGGPVPNGVYVVRGVFVASLSDSAE